MSKLGQRTFGVLAASFFALAACDNKPADTKPEEPTAKNSTTNATQPAADPVVTPTFADSDLVTPSDFQETADKTISKANYKTELASLETAVSKDD